MRGMHNLRQEGCGMNDLTERQLEVLEIIRKHIQKDGQAPTVREVAKGLGVSSTCTAHKHLAALEKKGLISKTKYGYRSIEIPGEFTPQKVQFSNVPLVGRVAAGLPLLAAENLDGYISVPAEMAQGDRLFALKVRGDSMKDVGIMDGDTIIARQQETAQNGDIVVAMIEDEATVKRFFREARTIRLMPENPDFAPIETPDVQVLGKVALSIRRF